MRVVVDLSSVVAVEERVLGSLRVEQPAGVKAILDAAAAEEVSTHAYQNRTGDAEASTYAGEVEKTDDGFAVEFGMRVDYASQLDTRGFTRIREVADRAEIEIGYYLEGARDAAVKG